VSARVKYTVNVANLVALVIQIIKWTISFVPTLRLNKKKIISKNFQFFQALGNFRKYFRLFLSCSISFMLYYFLALFLSCWLYFFLALFLSSFISFLLYFFLALFLSYFISFLLYFFLALFLSVLLYFCISFFLYFFIYVSFCACLSTCCLWKQREMVV